MYFLSLYQYPPSTVPYRVGVSLEKHIIITISDRRPEQERTYAHFVSVSDAERFADILEATLGKGHYAEIGCCPLCGKPFFRQEEFCILTNDARAHQKCFQKEVKNNRMEYTDAKERHLHLFNEELPDYDFCDLELMDFRFRYAIQTVSLSCVHLYLRENQYNRKNHLWLTVEECKGLIREIRERIKAVRQTEAGVCRSCGQPVYVDQDCYVMTSREKIHSRCMERFIRSEKAAQVTFPADRVRTYDVFSQRSYDYHNRNPFPKEETTKR